MCWLISRNNLLNGKKVSCEDNRFPLCDSIFKEMLKVSERYQLSYCLFIFTS